MHEGHRDVQPPLYVAFIRDLTEQKHAATVQARSHELELQNARIQEANWQTELIE